MIEISPLYIEARRVLLDALEALGEHRKSLILVGAHAVYLRAEHETVGRGVAVDLSLTPYTTDADLAIDPNRLEGDPLIAEALGRGGFQPALGSDRVGTWVTERKVEGVATLMALDLLVPDAVSGPGRRGARLGPHGDRSARKARGLEVALFDRGPLPIRSLKDGDARECVVDVAGPAALIVAKLHKVGERIDDARRNERIAKDAYDILRVFRAADIAGVAGTLGRLRRGGYPEGTAQVVVDKTRHVVEVALELLRREFSNEQRRGCRLARDAAVGSADQEIAAASLATLTMDLLSALEGS